MSKWKFEPFSEHQAYYRLGYDSEKEPGVKHIIEGARGQYNFMCEQLHEWLADAQDVWICNPPSETEYRTVHFVQPTDATHRAKLIMIEELPKEECKHEPAFVNKIPGWHHGPTSEVACRRCGIKMLAKWEAVK